MHLVHIFKFRMLVLHNPDWLSNNNVNRPAVWHHANVAVEDTTSVEDGDSEAHNFLDQQLELMQQRVRLAVDLVVNIILAESEDRHKVSASANGHLDETLAAAENKANHARTCIEGLASAANDDGDGTTHAFPVVSAL